MRSLFRLVCVGFLGLVGLVFANDSARAADQPTATCAPVSGPITVDGRLEEWVRGPKLRIADETQFVRRDEQYAGLGDLSGEIYIGRDATTLYVAGEILDDTLYWNSQITELGDSVEIFLDFSDDLDAREPDEGFDQHTHQLLLHPLAQEVPWRFARLKGQPGRMDDPVDGVRLVGLPLRDLKGATVGYTFELALPFSNFTDEPIEDGRVLGFDIALSDSDGLPEQKNYASWSGRPELYQRPARFGRMVVRGSPPAVAPPEAPEFSSTAPLAVLIATLGALLFLWLARAPTPGGRRLAAWLERVRRVRLRAKVSTALVIVGLLLLTELGATWVSNSLTRREIESQRELVRLVRDIAREADQLRLLQPQDPAESPLLSLLSGRSVSPPVEYDYAVVPPVAEVPHRTLDGTPFLRRDIATVAAWAGDFVVHPPVAARAATLVYSWQPEPGRERSLDAGDIVAEVRFVHRDGRVDAPTLLRYGRHVDDHDATLAGSPPEHPGAPAARVAFVSQRGDGDDAPAVHADQFTVALPPATTGTPLVRVEVEQTTKLGRFIVHGITLEPVADTDPLPLPLGRPTLTGIPTYASPAPARAAVLELSAEQPWVVLRDLDARADRLWLLVSLRRGYRPQRYRAPVLLVEAVFDDGSVDGPFRLENGLSVHAESTPARQHDESFQSPLGFEWGLAGRPRQPRRHVDVMSLPLARAGRTLRELQFEFAGEDEIVRVASITAGAENPSPRVEDPQFLDSGPEGYQINDTDRARLSGLAFTIYRDDASLAGALPGDKRDRRLAHRLTREQAEEIADTTDGVHEVRVVDGEEFHTLAFPLAGRRAGDVVELGWRSGVDARLEKTMSLVRALLSALLSVVLVLLVADLLMRVPSLHARLVLAFAAAAAVPVLLATFAVPEFVGAKIERAEAETVRQKAATVKQRLSELRSLARQRAEEAFRDEALQEALRRRGEEGYRAAVAAALRDLEHSISAAAGGEARVALEVTPLAAGGEALVFPEEAQWTVFAGPTVNVSDELAYRWSRLYASGVAQPTGADWRATLVVELPIGRATVEETARAAGGDTEVLLYTPRGYPLVATLETRGEDAGSEQARKRALMRRVVAEQQPVVEAVVLQGTLYTAAYDVLSGGSRDVSLVATAVPRTGTEALLNRVSTVSLLVFGAGMFMQFLLAGLVLGGTSSRFERTLGRARMAAPQGGEDGPADELAALGQSLEALRKDREVYRGELAHLHDAVGALASAGDPEEVVQRALDAVRGSVAPWGALLLAGAEGDAVDVLGGFRGDDEVAPTSVSVSPDDPLQPVLRGELTGDLGVRGDDASSELDRLVLGAERAEAYPLGGVSGPRGALVLLHAGARGAPSAFHEGFLATLARDVGLAYSSAQLVRLAVHDPGTGAYVPSYFDQRLRAEVDHAVAAKRPIALMLVRAEGLSDDAEGERLRRRLAETFRELAPARAFVGVQTRRTLAVAVPESDRNGAEALGRELQRAVAERGLPGIRLGLAAVPEDAGSCEFLQAEARRRLADSTSGRAPDTAPMIDEVAQLVEEARALGAVFQSPKGVQLLETVERIASSDLTILLEGETGTGKEVVADLIHHKSARRDAPLVKVNCAALPDTLLESELFGYEPGAFTGADRHKPGRFELADGGTLFLDEIGELPPATQVKLLRVLEDHAVEHLGGTRPVPVDVRVITATNRDLRGEVAAGRFREDLFYRLNAVSLVLPPLRARKEDIPVLVAAFVRRAAEAHGRRPPVLAPDAMDLLYRHHWPGNVRELRNAIEQAVVLSSSDTLWAADLAPALRAAPAPRTATRRVPRPSSGGDGELLDRQQRLLTLMGRQEWITNTEYCGMVGISTRTGLRDLRDLMERGLIVMHGKRRGARYRLA